MNVLLIGATGYIGRRLLSQLLTDKKIKITILARNPEALEKSVSSRVQILAGDTFSKDALNSAMSKVEVAYYLIHSMGSGKNYAELDRESARNFLDAAEKNKVKKIVYLGAPAVEDGASHHLISRNETGEVLSSGKVPVVWFRAGIIIGSGSASFEIVRHLVEKLPVMTTPKWVRTPTYPVSVKDVLSYLDAARHSKIRKSISVDIGCCRMTFSQMLIETAEALGLKRRIIPVPLMSPRISSYWLILFTPVPFSMASPLVDGLKSKPVFNSETASGLFPEIHPLDYRTAVKQALEEMESRVVLSRWSDSAHASGYILKSLTNLAGYSSRLGFRVDTQKLSVEEIFDVVERIGGQHGWYHFGLLWSLRGLIDKLMGGYGTSRGRREESRLRVGDSLDFWKVVEYLRGRRLLLYSQMRLPGKGWLEFVYEDQHFSVNAYFIPHGVWGRLYWFFLLPVHWLIFRDIAQSIVRDARKQQKQGRS